MPYELPMSSTVGVSIPVVARYSSTNAVKCGLASCGIWYSSPRNDEKYERGSGWV